MADVREMRIFSADQIEVPEKLPEILKDFSKEVIRSSPQDIISFSREYFEQKAAEQNAAEKRWPNRNVSQLDITKTTDASESTVLSVLSLNRNLTK